MADVVKGDPILASDINAKLDKTALVTFASEVDVKINTTNTNVTNLTNRVSTAETKLTTLETKANTNSTNISTINSRFSKLVFVGTDAQWNALSDTEKANYILRGIPL